jgi:hypothetical protein
MAEKFDEATQVLALSSWLGPRIYLTVQFTSLQKELASFIEQEQAKERMNTSIHTFTDMCWDKLRGRINYVDCVTYTFSLGSSDTDVLPAAFQRGFHEGKRAAWSTALTDSSTLACLW